MVVARITAPGPRAPPAPSAEHLLAPAAPAAPVLGACGPPDPWYGNRLPVQVPTERRPAPPGEGYERDGDRSVALSTAFGGRNRPKAFSCTLVLSVAGALAAATTAAVVFHVLPGNGDDAKGGAVGDRPSVSSSAGSAQSAVPRAFLGTWQGDLTSDSGFPVGTMTLTIRRGSVGRQVASGRVKLSVLRCDSTWTLVSATPKQLHLDAKLKGAEPQEGCSNGSTDERFTLESGTTLAYRAKDKAAGNPTGTLRKLQ